MALVASPNPQPRTGTQLKAIAWLRWRLFLRAFNKTGAGSVVLWLLIAPFALMIYVVALCGPGFLAYAAVAAGGARLFSALELLLWGIALLALMLPLLSSAAAPPFEFASLIRFPFRYRGYLAMRLVYSIIDQPTILLGLATLGIFSGSLFASTAFAVHAIPALLLYALSCFFFVRMLLVWLDRWLAQRRSREILGFFSFLFAMSMQFGFRAMHNLSGIAAAHPAAMPYLHALHRAARLLPPTLAVHAMTSTSAMAYLGNLFAVAVFALIFFALFDRRLRLEYRGENLGEAPARKTATAATVRKVAAVPRREASHAPSARASLLPATVYAVAVNEFRLLFRGNAKVQQLVAPVLIAVFITFRTHSRGVHSGTIGWMTVIGYMVFLIANSMMNNVLGAEGFGLQLYFLAPVRMRDVFLGKNIMTLAVGGAEFVAVYLTMTLIGSRPSAHALLLSMAWLAFTVPVCFCIGNLMSMYMPRRFDPGAVRRRAAASGAGWLTMLILPLLAGLGVGIYWAARHFDVLWVAYASFAVFAAAAMAAYTITLTRLDAIAEKRREKLNELICRTA